MARTQQHRHIAVGTPLGEDVLLMRGLSYTESLGAMFELDLDLLSTKADVDFDQIVGANVTARLNLPNNKVRYFNGFVRRFSQVGWMDRMARYRATVVPWLWFLTQTSDCRIYQGKDVKDIIKEVFRDNGFTDFDDRLTGSYTQWTNCVQYRETDFNFVSRLMEREGIYYFFTHENGKHTLVLADSIGAHRPWPGYEQVPYYPPSGQMREGEHVFDWTIQRQVQSGTYTHTDFDFTSSRTDLLASRKITRSDHAPDFEIYDYPGAYEKFAAGENYARLRIEEVQAGYETLRGEATARGLGAGFTFSLASPPRADQERNYLITGVSLSASTDAYDSGAGEGAAGELFDCSFSAIDSQQPYRQARTTPRPMIRGIQTAMVVGPAGEEIHTDKYGRVKVQFHWDRYGKSDENSSCWVRVAQVWAGKKWGAMYIPRIGQEVIVEFEEGDPDRPLITGRVYNDATMPPYDLPGEKTMSTLKSDSSKGGGGFNEIRFEDKKGGEQLFIHAQKNEDIVVLNNKTEKVGVNETISIGNDRSDTVGHNETRVVAADRSRTVGANEVVTVGLTRTHTVGVNEAITIGAAQEITVGAAQTITVGATQQVSIGGPQQVKVGASQGTSVGKDMSVDVGKTLSIVAGDQITIKTGKASIMMKKDGTINITGKDITIKGSGQVTAKATKDVVIKGKKILEN